MSDQPDLEHVFTHTLGYCEAHGQTAFVCAKCHEADLALVKEAQTLREENRLLRETLTEIDGFATSAAETANDEYKWMFRGILEMTRAVFAILTERKS